MRNRYFDRFDRIQTDYDPENDCPDGPPVTWVEKALFDRVEELTDDVQALSNRLAYLETAGKVTAPEPESDEAQVDGIAAYLIEENFTTSHLMAIRKLIGLFNYSKESEQEIFRFVDRLNSKYLQSEEYPESSKEHLVDGDEVI